MIPLNHKDSWGHDPFDCKEGKIELKGRIPLFTTCKHWSHQHGCMIKDLDARESHIIFIKLEF